MAYQRILPAKRLGDKESPAYHFKSRLSDKGPRGWQSDSRFDIGYHNGVAPVMNPGGDVLGSAKH